MRHQRACVAPGAIICVLVLSTALLAGCVPLLKGSALPSPTASAPPSPTATTLDRVIATTGCNLAPAVAPGASQDVVIPADPTISAGQTTRSFRLHVPVGYHAGVPLPVVLIFHGYGGTALGMEQETGFSTLADRERFLAVYPQGLLENGAPFWASAGPIDQGVEEIPFVNDLLTLLQRHYCVDAQRIYATGFSKGGGMVGYLACRLAVRIAAVAPIAGNYYKFPGGCQPSRPISILEIHGVLDQIVPYEGISKIINPGWPLPAIPDWLQDWALRDGCAATPTVFLRSAEVTGEQWSGCRAQTAVVHYRIEHGGHAIPATLDGRPSNEVLWRFFQTHSL